MAHIALLSVATHIGSQAKMKSVSFLETASIYRPDDKIIRRHHIHFWFFCTNFKNSHFISSTFSVLFTSHFQFVFDKFVNNRFMTMKSSKILLAFAFVFNVKSYANLMLAGRHLPYFEYCDSHMPYLKNHFWISQNTDQKTTCIFSINVTRSFTLPHGSLYSSYTRSREGREKNLKWYAIFFLFGVSVKHYYFFSVYMCECIVYECDPAFFFQKKTKSLFSLNLYFECSRSKRKRERDTHFKIEYFKHVSYRISAKPTDYSCNKRISNTISLNKVWIVWIEYTIEYCIAHVTRKGFR